MIDYGMGSLPAGVYIMTMTFSVHNFEHEWKNDVVVNTVTLFVRGVLWMSSFLGHLKPLNKKLNLCKILT